MDYSRRSIFKPLQDPHVLAPTAGIPRPNARQLAFQELELGLFIHFGIMTFGHSASNGQGSPVMFDPTELDCDNWMATARAMGAQFAVLTTRHEEGFCLWPTRTTDYSVKSAPYRNGKGSVVREFVDACRRNDIKPCLYHCSYMDAHHLFQPEDSISWHKEWFATTRKRLEDRVLYERFKSMQCAQVRELLTEFGDITYLWLDHITETQGILDPVSVEDFWKAIVKTARDCQPDCLLLKCDVYLSRDTSCQSGVHGGRAAYPLWHACSRVDTPEGQCDPVPDPNNGDQYLVWESNTIFSGNWFWNGESIKPVDDMVEHYFNTIGRGSTFLPNFAPSPTGKMTDSVIARAREFGRRIRDITAHPVAFANNPCDGEMILLGDEPFAIIEIMENLQDGQKISAYVVEVRRNGIWEKLVDGESVGHRRLHRITPVRAEAIRIRCLKSLADEPVLRRLAVYSVR